MASKVKWSQLVPARVIKVVATAALAFLGVIGSPETIWIWILASVCFGGIILLEVNAYKWEQNRPSRLGSNYEIVLGKVLSLIADLSELTGGDLGLWVVDLYLPGVDTNSSQMRDRKLKLSLHIALKDVRTVPNEIELSHGFFGCCFEERRPKLWWDVTLAPSNEENSWDQLDESQNEKFRKDFGIISVNPVADNLRENSSGLLVIHAMRDEIAVRKVLGALTSQKGKRRISVACVDIYNLMGTANRGHS